MADTDKKIIDLSNNNGRINWPLLIPNVKAVILKSSEGVGYEDPSFLKNAKSATVAGIPWGAYHFATWNKKPVERDAVEEGNYFLSVLKKAPETPSFGLWLDVESNHPIPYTKKEMVTYMKTFIAVVQGAGFEIGVYGSPGFLNSYLPENHPFANLKLWVADYTGAINRVVGNWTPFLHQYTENGNIPGITGKVDLNRKVG